MKSIDPLEPPAELDRIVIGKARKAIQATSALRPYRAPKCALPVGLAATILLCFAILLDLGVRAKRNDASLQAALSAPSVKTAPAQVPAQTAVQARPEVPSPAAPADPVWAEKASPRAADAEEALSADGARSRFARAEKAAKRARAEPETTDARPAPPVPAATWLARIDELRKSGQTAAAESEMKRFRVAYPDYPVPRTDP
jgi:hypothetical protein